MVQVHACSSSTLRAPYFDIQTVATVHNSILWNNGNLEALLRGRNSRNQPPALFVDHSDVRGGFPGLGNISADPKLLHVLGANMHLHPSSPCIQGGSLAAPHMPRVDIDGQPRVLNGVRDMGADEFARGQPRLAARVPGVSRALGGTVPLDVLRTRAAGLAVLVPSFSGSRPGVVYAGKRIPVNVDETTGWLLGSLPGQILPTSTGKTTTQIRFAPGLPREFVGRSMTLAACIWGVSGIKASNEEHILFWQ